MIQFTQQFQHNPSVCTNNKETNSYKEYITEFQKGPCSPMIFLPGLTGSSLHVEIDCTVMKPAQATNSFVQKILHDCPFICKGSTKSYENVIWMTHETMWNYAVWADFNWMWKRRECFVSLISVHKQKVQVDDKSDFN